MRPDISLKSLFFCFLEVLAKFGQKQTNIEKTKKTKKTEKTKKAKKKTKIRRLYEARHFPQIFFFCFFFLCFFFGSLEVFLVFDQK